LRATDAVLEFSRDIVHKLACPACGEEEELFAPVRTVDVARAQCPRDGAMRAVIAIHNYTGTESYGCRKLNELGLPLWDVYVARAGEREIALLISGDAASVLGHLSLDDGAPV
jgi:hypothetical protein